MNANELARHGRETTRLLREAHDGYDNVVIEAAKAEQEYRKARHLAHVKAHGTVDEKKAWVDAETADLRYIRDVANGLVKGALELIRSRRQDLSYLQTLANQSREEAAFVRTGPEGP